MYGHALLNSLCLLTWAEQPCQSQLYHNVDFRGADYKFLFTSSDEECQRVCTQDPHCRFFTFANSVFTAENIRYNWVTWCFIQFKQVADLEAEFMSVVEINLSEVWDRHNVLFSYTWVWVRATDIVRLHRLSSFPCDEWLQWIHPMRREDLCRQNIAGSNIKWWCCFFVLSQTQMSP